MSINQYICRDMTGIGKTLMILLAVMLLILMPCTIIKADQKKTNANDEPYHGLFSTDHVHEINVEIDEADWKDLLDHPLDKTKYEVSVIIDGETLNQVSMSTKGNSSLNLVERQGSSRFSFKLNFGKYNKNQTYHGLDKMKLSNLFSDESGLEDYISYRTITEAGGYAPLASYAWLKINGEDYGLYLTVEELGKGWINRTQKGKGDLYKPDPEWATFDIKIPGVERSRENLLDSMKAARKYYGDSDLGAGLVYVDDKPKSYPAIFKNAETKAKKKDKKRLIQSLKVLNSDNPAPVVNTDEVIGYFAGHNFTMNYDSYTGIMSHNYYLYEDKGILSAVAWDYNGAFGGFLKTLHPDMNTTDIINWGIDTPLCDTELADRPFWAWIVNDKAYLEQYHNTMDELLKNYYESGRCEQEMSDIHKMIKPYIEKDPTFLYTKEEFEDSYKAMKNFCKKRTESIRSQLSGKLSPDIAKQKEAAKVDAANDPLP